MNEEKTILLAEDEATDVFIMQRAVRKMNLPISLQIAKDGEQAIEYLAGCGKYADRNLYPLPDLILLDIKMPRRNGFEVLEWLRHKHALAHIPVVIVSSSKMPRDVERAHDLGARAYLVKPAEFDELRQLFTATEDFLGAHAV